MVSNHTDEHNVFYAAVQAIRRHSSGGNILIAATILALIIANIPGVNQYYFDFLTQEVRLQFGEFNLFSHGGQSMNFITFINDALMAIFFLSIGLEVKREILVGELSSFKHAFLPIIAAIGGMVVPVVIYTAFAKGTDFIGGAAIPMATDIAFSLGILTLLGNRVPIALKIFLTTLAVVDDIGGIIVIAIFYSSHIDVTYLLYAIVFFALLLLGSRLHIKSKIYYFCIGGIIWFLFLNSGIHPTIAGVLIAFCVPVTPVFAPEKYIKTIRKSISNFRGEDDSILAKCSILNKNQMNWLKEIESASDKVISPLQDLEDSLHPIVNYFIIPLFAFANAGIFLLDTNPAIVTEGISLAIICSLFAGKFIGILSFSWITVKLKFASLPTKTNWKMIASVSMLGGIGFTVSMFIAGLTFHTAEQSDMLNHAKLGIIIGSILSGIIGFALLRRTLPDNQNELMANT